MAATLSPPRILPSGDSAITVEFSRNIDDAANQRVLALDRTLASEPVTGVTETVPTYRSLLVHYDPVVIDFETLGEKLVALAGRAGSADDEDAALAHSRDLWRRARHRSRGGRQDPEDHARRHRGAPCRRRLSRRHDRFHAGLVLSQRARALSCTCRGGKNPRLLTPAGTISIGGVQAGIQCLAGPSGWHLLGRTAVRTYQLHRDPTFLLEPGDRVTFSVVDAKTFAEQDRAAEHGEIVAELIAA